MVLNSGPPTIILPPVEISGPEKDGQAAAIAELRKRLDALEAEAPGLVRAKVSERGLTREAAAQFVDRFQRTVQSALEEMRRGLTVYGR